MILVKTEMGQRLFKDRSVRISPRQRSAFILFDGKRSVNDVLQAGMGIAAEDIDQMIVIGMLIPLDGEVHGAGDKMSVRESMPFAAGVEAAGVQLAEADGVRSPPPAAPGVSGRSSQQRYKDAYPIATRLSGSLGLRGFRLNLAVEGTSTYEELLALAPMIRAAVGPDKAAELDRALND